MLALAADGYGLRRVVAITVPENEASARVLERLGMTHERTLDNDAGPPLRRCSPGTLPHPPFPKFETAHRVSVVTHPAIYDTVSMREICVKGVTGSLKFTYGKADGNAWVVPRQ